MGQQEWGRWQLGNRRGWLLRAAHVGVLTITAGLPGVGRAQPVAGPSQAVQAPAVREEELRFLDNGMLKVGLKPASGGAIAWVSLSGSDRNLVNAYDRGRLIQQSYYGREDGSLWNQQPWRWNPVQGGDWRGKPARTERFEVTGYRAYVKSVPRHWANGEELDTCRMEQTLELDGPVARVHYKFTQRGGQEHPERDQELPAVFTAPDLKTLVLYDGPQPWSGGGLHRSQPGWPNESRTLSEPWAAYVDDRDFGLGVYVPVADRLTCYRYGADATQPDACSYFAPLRRMAIGADFEWEYEIAVSVGTVEQLRARFQALHEAPQ
jgi:hypothetical protein